MPRYELRNTSDNSKQYAEAASLPIDLMLHVPPGTYRPRAMSDEAVNDIVVPTLTAGTIDQSSPTVGDVLTVTGGNAPTGATYLWEVNTGSGFGAASGTNDATEYDTEGRAVGAYRRTTTAGPQTASTASVTLTAPVVADYDQIVNIASGNRAIAIPNDLPALLGAGEKVSVFALIYWDGTTELTEWQAIWSLANVSTANQYQNLTAQRLVSRDVSQEYTPTVPLTGSARYIPITLIVERDPANATFAFATIKREGGLIADAVQLGYWDNVLAVATRIVIGCSGDSNPADYFPAPIAHVIWGLGDAAAFHDAFWNNGTMGVNPETYNFSGSGFTPLRNLPLMRVNDASAFDVADIDDEATTIGTGHAWTALPAALPY